MTTTSAIQPFDRDLLRRQYRSASPFPFVYIDGFLERGFVDEVVCAYPPFEEALALGRSFQAVNEKRKVQVTDYSRFPEAVKRLSDALASKEFLDDLAHVTGIRNLLWDAELEGGGMHQTAAAGRLDVHVDFNYIKERDLHRRLNILVYLNPEWKEDWGGRIELWDRDVRKCHHSFSPVQNRCVIFETSAVSYHGVTPLTSPPGVVRKSFAAYYYTKEAPPSWTGKEHSTIFRARPDEIMKGLVFMPAEKARYAVKEAIKRTKRRIRDVVVPR